MLATLGCAVAIGACGSSGKSSNGSGSGGRSSGIAVAQCMRAHGITDFPDPSGSGGGIQLPAGINPQSPGFESAQKTCFKLLPGGGPTGGHASESQKRQMLAMSECMRRHGLSTFPDPVTTAPAPGTGFGLAFGAPGSFIAIPQALLNSPAFNQAAAACGLPGAGRGGGHKAAVMAP
jgi:hypothetical protein